MVDKKFWKKRKVLLTGNTGFKGSWCHLLLHELQADVIGYSRDIPTNPSSFQEISSNLELNTIYGDILDRDLLNDVMNNFKPEVVIHMAAQAIVKTSYIDPFDTYNTNVLGTLNVMEASRKSGSVEVLINVTSDKCYENNELNIAFKEEDRLGGKDIYSSSKACAEILSKSYSDSFLKEKDSKLKIASVRAGNVIGGGDWSEDRLLPDIIRSLDGQNLIIRNPEAIRPWQHVLDPIHGYLKLANILFLSGSSEFLGGWNFGPDKNSAKSVRWILNESSKYLMDLDYKFPNKELFKEASYLKLDSSKAKNHLNWEPVWNAEQALEKTINWYLNYNLQKESADSLMYKDINSYWDSNL